MVAAVSTSDASRQLASPGKGVDGVVRIKMSDGVFGTGVLLYDGRHVLTARHLLNTGANALGTLVTFETERGTWTVGVSEALGLKSWNATNLQSDLLLLKLQETAPQDADRYDLYRDQDEIGQSLVMAGYGVSGTGNAGAGSEAASSTLRRYAENRFDGEMSALKALAGSRLSWSPPTDSQLWADFDNGLAAQDATRLWTGQADLGRGSKEGMITPGDSGSPAFVNGQVAGVASYTFTSSAPAGTSDIDAQANSSFGEVAVWQRISSYQQWIDQNVRKAYPNAPTKAEEVKASVAEGNGGTSYAYFLVQFHGLRSDAGGIVSVDYTTRDGTAKAGQDYLATSGTLNLYAEESHGVIAVEILGDTVPEADEVFYLDVTNPVGGSFGEGVVKLTAVRTILNDDGAWG